MDFPNKVPKDYSNAPQAVAGEPFRGEPNVQDADRAIDAVGPSLRQIDDHLTPYGSTNLIVVAADEPGPGGAHHRYDVVMGDEVTSIEFQKGTVPEVGLNGLTNEAVIAMVIDRLRSFQNGPFRCRENACALTHLEEAMMWLHKRTRDRAVRGVEGTHKV